MAAKIWTEAQIRDHGVTVPGVKACEIVYGCGKTKALELLRAGEVDFPVLRRGRSYIVPTQSLLELLGLVPERRVAG